MRRFSSATESSAQIRSVYSFPLHLTTRVSSSSIAVTASGVGDDDEEDEAIYATESRNELLDPTIGGRLSFTIELQQSRVSFVKYIKVWELFTKLIFYI